MADGSSTITSSGSLPTSSSTPSASSAASTNTFSVSPTFTDPFPRPTSNGGGGGGGGGGSGGGGGGGGGNFNDRNALASSASLYLYTFLATLVLLLGVSAAIVIRSLLLRRRHRRMIEEAIRNGTWVPPANSSRTKVDPSMKPKMYEAYLAGAGGAGAGGVIAPGGQEKHTSDVAEHPLAAGYSGGGKYQEEHLDWDTMMPISLQLLTTPTWIDPSNPDGGNTNSPTPASSNPNLNAGSHVERPSFPTRIRRFLSSAWAIVVPRDSPTNTDDPTPIRNNSINETMDLQNLAPWNNSSSPLHPTFSSPSPLVPQQLPPPNALTTSPSLMRVSVFIVMPNPHPIPVTKHGDEEELPVLEMGVADVDVGTEYEGGTGSVAEGSKGKRVSEDV
ncbi:hypothetical protein WG66_000074 [Moniliophthora roreri]|uniref:Uncharacterized protein n=1 Tax=Moniliophthora roreri TaxID=221103 RepID=A0A0W0FWR7_MONRR|nr:hypothetical protein WG66_000074 [Moniliophthora roreri]